MPFHVRITPKSDGSRHETKFDLTEQHLKEKFVVSYQTRQPIFINGRTISADDLDRIEVVKTTHPWNQMDELTRHTAKIALHWCDVIKGTDVTDDFINAPAAILPEVTREGIFFAGQHYDAFQCIADILSQAKNSIVIIDAYVDESVLKMLTSKSTEVEVNILTKKASNALSAAAIAFNKQYGGLSIRTSSVFHDQFVILDNKDFYHFGASIKDLGSKGFMFSRIEEPSIIDALRVNFSDEWSRATSVI